MAQWKLVLKYGDPALTVSAQYLAPDGVRVTGYTGCTYCCMPKADHPANKCLYGAETYTSRFWSFNNYGPPALYYDELIGIEPHPTEDAIMYSIETEPGNAP